MKRLISVLLVFAIVFGLMSGLNIGSNASTGIENKIQAIQNKYPSGSYFSSNGKGCGGSSYGHSCSNCSLQNIDSSAYSACGGGYSCWAFANYVFYHVFGVSPSNSRNTSIWCGVGNLNQYAQYGDYIECYNSADKILHYFIYLGGSGYVNCYRYESNVNDNPNMVNIENKAQSNGGFSSFKIIHAYNYSSLNEEGLGQPTNVQAKLEGKKLVLTWNAVSGANCYDVILTDPSGTTNWYHTTSNKRDIYLTKTGSYSLDVQSLYRPNGSSTGQIVGGHSDKLNFTVSIFGPSGVNITREGTSIAVTWDAEDGANCYDVIVKNPKGETNWYHAIDCEKIFTNCIPGQYTFDIQSLYRPNGTSTGQTVGSHSGEYPYNFTLEGPENLRVSNDENDKMLIEWNAVDGATCYDIIVTKPDGNTDYLHTHETNKTISNYDFGTYHINVQSLYRENEWTSNQFQVVGGHSDVIDYDYQPTIHHHTLVIDEAIAPGCIEPGKTQGSHCSTCGEIIVKQEVIPALGHVFQTEILNESTCLVTGLKKLTCSVCGEEITETIPVTAHKYESQIIEPTCTHMGYAIFTCKDCHFSYIGEYVERVEHIYHETVITPTTESQGYTVHTCKDCGFSYVDSITDILPSQMHYLIPSLKDINTTLTVKSRENEYMVTASTGVFALDSIKGDIYRVYASQKNSLTVCVGEYDTKLGEVINNEEVFIPLGDVNGDDVIDIADVSVLLSTENYGQTNSELDLTGDNSINIADIAVTLQETNYGKASVAVV